MEWAKLLWFCKIKRIEGYNLKKILKMFLLSILLSFMLFIAICFEDFKIRMGIVIFMYSFSFFAITKCKNWCKDGGIKNEY